MAGDPVTGLDGLTVLLAAMSALAVVLGVLCAIADQHGPTDST